MSTKQRIAALDQVLPQVNEAGAHAMRLGQGNATGAALSVCLSVSWRLDRTGLSLGVHGFRVLLSASDQVFL